MLTSTSYKTTIKNTFIKSIKNTSYSNIWDINDEPNMADMAYTCMKQSYLKKQKQTEHESIFNSPDFTDTFDGSLLSWSTVPDRNKVWKDMISNLEKEQKMLKYQIENAEIFQKKLILQQLRKTTTENNMISLPVWKAVIEKRLNDSSHTKNSENIWKEILVSLQQVE